MKAKHIQKLFTLLLLLLFMGMDVSSLRAQNLVLRKKNGTEQIKQLSTLKNITFSNDNLLINYLIDPTDFYSRITIRKLYFKTASTGIDNLEKNKVESISIYPNPVNNIIYIQNSGTNTSMVYIYRMDGILVMNTQASPGIVTINVSNLANGFYLIKVNNQVIKFIKL